MADDQEHRPRWRVGRKLGRTLYVDEVFVGMVDTPELAAKMVHALNEERPVDERAQIVKYLRAIAADAEGLPEAPLLSDLAASIEHGMHWREASDGG